MRPLLEIRGVTKRYPLKGRGERTLTAVDDVDVTVERGATLAIVGESGSGKSTIAKMLTGLVAPTHGEILLDGRAVSSTVTLEGAGPSPVQLVAQNPWSALNRRKRIRHILEQPLRARGVDRRARATEVGDLLEVVGLPIEYMSRYPRDVSGGELQRVTIARALAAAPELLVLDEPTSSVDVSVKARLINLFRRLHVERGLTILVITHELDVARHLADDIAVMHMGRFVEVGPAEQILERPRAPYTRSLLAAVPDLARTLAMTEGDGHDDGRPVAHTSGSHSPGPAATDWAGTGPDPDPTHQEHT